jgi:hypothetical protein
VLVRLRLCQIGSFVVFCERSKRIASKVKESSQSPSTVARKLIVLKLESESRIGSVGSRTDAVDAYKVFNAFCVQKEHKSYLIILKYLNVSMSVYKFEYCLCL